MLRTALGPARFLDHPKIVEVMLNPDGRLWVDQLSNRLTDTGQMVCAPDGERIYRAIPTRGNPIAGSMLVQQSICRNGR